MSDFDLVTPGQVESPKPATDAETFELAMPVNDLGKPKKTPQQELREEMMAKSRLGPKEAALMRGMTWGLSDPLFAGVQSMLHGTKYKEEMERLQGARDAYAGQHPWGSMAMELGGSLASGGPIVNATKGALSKAFPSVVEYAGQTGLAPAVLRALGVLGGGAASGAVTGATQAKPGNEVQGAVKGGEIGALTSGAMKVAGKTASAIYDKALKAPMQHIGNYFGTTKPEKWAEEEFLKSLGMDSQDLAGLTTKMGQLDPAGKADLRVMDVAGINAKNKLKSALTTESEAKAKYDQLFQDRSKQQKDTLYDIIGKGTSPRADAANVSNEIHQQALEKAKPLYDELSAMGRLDDPRIAQWFSENPFRAALLRDYAAYANKKGTPVATVGTGKDTVFQPTWDQLLELYRSKLGAMKNDAFDSAKGVSRFQSTEYPKNFLQDEYNNLRGLMNDISGNKFAAAQKISGEAAEVRKAIELGKNITKPNYSIRDMQGDIGKLTSDAEVEAYKTGAASVLTTMVDNAKNGATSVTKLTNDALNNKVNLLFPNGEVADYYQKTLANEAVKAETARQLAPRVSPNATPIMDQAPSPDAIGAVFGAMAGHPGQTVGFMRRMFSNDWEQTMPEYSNKLALLGLMNKDELADYAKQIAERNSGALNRVGAMGKNYASSVINAAPYSSAAYIGGQRAISDEDKNSMFDSIFNTSD